MTALAAVVETLPETRPIEVVTPIKPSEAIRLGCLIAPIQAFGGSGQGDWACAGRAMYLGANGEEMGYEPWLRFLDPVSNLPCPRGHIRPFDYTDGLLPHLNDDHRWSRERIADWLESRGL